MTLRTSNSASQSQDAESLLWIVNSPTTQMEEPIESSAETSQEWCTKSFDFNDRLTSTGLYNRWISDGAIAVSREERIRDSIFKRCAIQNYCLWSRRSFHRSPTPDAIKPKYTTQQKLTAFCLCLVNFTSFLSMSIIAPFFPKEAAQKGMREAVSGFVFSIYALVMMLTSPFFGKLLPRCGPKYLFISGVLLAGVCNILFGFLDQIENPHTFTALCFIIRIFEALGAASFATATYTFVMEIFPEDIGTVFGILETFIGLGMSMGPAVGGFLYTLGGYGLPFFTLGTFVILNIPMCWFLLPAHQNERDLEESTTEEGSFFKLLTLPKVIVASATLAIGSQTQGFLDPTLEPHMRQFDVGAGVVGLLFLLLSAAYAIFSPLSGWLGSRLPNQFLLMGGGLAAMTLGMLCLAPAPFMPFEASYWSSIVCIVVLGIAFAFAFVPTFEVIFLAALEGGFEDNLATYSMVSALWNSMYALGEVTGPSLGGVLSDFLSFQWAATIVAACSGLAFALVLVPCISRSRRRMTRHRRPHQPKELEDSIPLLKEKSIRNYS